MRIGELLLEQRKLRQSDLTRALAEKPADKRLCSYLVTKGLVDFDDAARALGEQKGVPCALSKHLAGRDPDAASLLPAELGRSSVALPIGKSSRGDIIVCVRDPAPALKAALEKAIGQPVTMVVTIATRLEHLVRDAYGEAPVEEFDVDFSSSVDMNPITSPVKPPPLPDLAALDPDSVRLSLTDLDDARVDKDFTQSGQIPIVGRRPPSTPPANRPAMGRNTKPMSMDTMRVGLEHATSREAATDVVLAYVATRWLSGLVFAIRDRTAIGYRGHRVIAPESVSLPLTSPSTVQAAVDTRIVTAQAPSGAAQATLARALSGPSLPTAAPVIVGGQPVAVLAVGDPIEADTNTTADLATLADALGGAYARIVAR